MLPSFRLRRSICGQVDGGGAAGVPRRHCRSRSRLAGVRHIRMPGAGVCAATPHPRVVQGPLLLLEGPGPPGHRRVRRDSLTGRAWTQGTNGLHCPAMPIRRCAPGFMRSPSRDLGSVPVNRTVTHGWRPSPRSTTLITRSAHCRIARCGHKAVHSSVSTTGRDGRPPDGPPWMISSFCASPTVMTVSISGRSVTVAS